MSTSIDIDLLDNEYGFMSSRYPAPFVLDGKRWRSFDQYYRSKIPTTSTYNDDDSSILDGLISKYTSNPYLTHRLLQTAPSTLVSNDIPSLAKHTMYLRDEYFRRESDDDINTIFDNLYSILQSQGYTRVISPNDVPILQGPRSSELMNIRISNDDKTQEAILDVYLTSKYTEKRLKDVISTKGNVAYYVVTQLSKQNMNLFLRIATYNSVKFFSPSDLFVTPSKHMLNSQVEKLSRDSPEYKNIISSVDTKLPEISVSDKLCKEMGLEIKDIIIVRDFSPHYRIVV